MNQVQFNAGAARAVTIRPAPKRQVPLPPFDTSGNPATTLPANQRTLPSGWDRKFWRGSAFNFHAGAPFVQGGSSEYTDLVLSWFLDRYPADWQTKILTQQAEQGYTHFSLSLSDSLAYGQTMDQFIGTCRLLKAWGYYVHVFLGSKDYDPANDSWGGWWRNIAANQLLALVDARCVDMITPGWEWDIWNVPGQTTFDIYQGLASIAVPAGIDVWTHFSTHVTWWGQDGSDRFAWWNSMRGILTGILYQGDVNWDMGMRQARAADTLNQNTFADGTFKFVYWEADATNQFNSGNPDNATAAMHGYLMLCSPGGCAVSGFGNGCWLVDGTPTLLP